jgi:hypothetical protein
MRRREDRHHRLRQARRHNPKHAPVIISEWISGAYFCDADTPESTVQFLQYLQEHGIGLEVVFGTGLQEASVAPAGLPFAQGLQLYWPLVPPEGLRPWKSG